MTRRPPAFDWTDEQVLALVRAHETLVRSYLASLGCPADRVEDLAQETFLRLLRTPPRQRSTEELRGFLCVAARNLLWNERRAEASGPRLEALDPAWVEFEGTDGGSAYVEALRGCLDQLPGRAREALRLRFASDLSRAAIAARLEVSLGGVKSLLLRSKQRLRTCVRRKLGGGALDSLEATP